MKNAIKQLIEVVKSEPRVMIEFINEYLSSRGLRKHFNIIYPKNRKKYFVADRNYVFDGSKIQIIKKEQECHYPDMSPSFIEDSFFPSGMNEKDFKKMLNSFLEREDALITNKILKINSNFKIKEGEIGTILTSQHLVPHYIDSFYTPKIFFYYYILVNKEIYDSRKEASIFDLIDL